MPRMKELIEAGLFGRGLIPIEGKTLVVRYNACLRDMGLPPTELSSFQIDQMGWSPEIAAEQGKDYYLSLGEANPVAIVLTPLQADAPIYFPCRSFEWRMMGEWFRTHRVQIADVTKDTGIWLDMEEGVDLYADPRDLQMVGEVLLRAHTPSGLMVTAANQQTLVRRFLAEPEAHLDVVLIQALEQSASGYGDLRKRQLVIRDYQFSDVQDFYDRYAGGTFVLRSRNQRPLTFTRNADHAKQFDEVWSADQDALPMLLEYGYLATDVDWWQNHLYRLEVIAESFLIDVLDEYEPRLDYSRLNDGKRKQLLQKYQDELSVYLELQRAADALKKGEVPKVAPSLAPFLLHPSDELEAGSREVVWQLLTYILGGRFVPLLYRHQKSDFVRGFTKEWKKPRRSWALARVEEFYEIASKSSGLEL